MVDDEISLTLQNFMSRPPELISRRNITTGGSKTTSKKKQEQKQRSFSSVQYDGHVLRLSYLTDRIILSKFEVTATTKPHSVRFVSISNNSDEKFQMLVERLCGKLSSIAAASDSSNMMSLSAVVSKLLQALNNVPPPNGNLSDVEQSDFIRKCVSQYTTMSLRILDMQLLLLRCAAAGKHSANFCTPIPDEFHGEGWLGERILAVTEQMNSTELLSGQRNLHKQEQALLGMLHSLPWSGQGTLTSSSSSQKSSNFELCFDMEAIRGEPSPRFSQLAKERGVATVFHGTKMENVWSILNCGLWTLSETKFCQHGSILGKGVYFSNNYRTATMFALNQARNCTNSESFQKAWWHFSLVNLLNLSSFNVLEEYTITCFPVFEAQIILPPADGMSTIDEDCTRREGNYFVVPNSWDIRITKLHLTFTFTKKRSMSPFLFAAILALLLIGWMKMYAQAHVLDE
mmetsp:Transcript_13024/g.18234  ORF Transcript_13024/g.18234 Transcript_13024/m.18234 type:complete len:459 (-) Transcript_13024:95-1471(-)